MDTNYKIIINAVAFAIKQLRASRKGTNKNQKDNINNKIHTLLVTKWIGAHRFNISTDNTNKELKNFQMSTRVKIFDELYFLKHYQFGYADFVKYSPQFKEEVGYDLVVI